MGQMGFLIFRTFDGQLKDQGYPAMGGQIIDASIVAVPKQRNSREENARIKAAETPEGWEDKPAKRRQKDVEPRWTKKHGRSHYGYKNHVNVDRRHKPVRRYHVSDAATHDSNVLDDIDELIRGGIAYRDSEERGASARGDSAPLPAGTKSGATALPVQCAAVANFSADRGSAARSRRSQRPSAPVARHWGGSKPWMHQHSDWTTRWDRSWAVAQSGRKRHPLVSTA